MIGISPLILRAFIVLLLALISFTFFKYTNFYQDVSDELATPSILTNGIRCTAWFFPLEIKLLPDTEQGWSIDNNAPILVSNAFMKSLFKIV